MKVQRLCVLACMLGMSAVAAAQPSAVTVQPGEQAAGSAGAGDRQSDAPPSGDRAAGCADKSGACGDSSGASGAAGSSASGGDEVRGESGSSADTGRVTSDRAMSRTWEGIGSTGGGTGTGESSGTTADPAPAGDGRR